MIKRLYVDNFKCLVNFEFRPAPLQLLFGENGTGKSTAINVLATLREFVTWGRPAAELFPIATLTAWQTRPEQTFELEVEGGDGTYLYKLVVEHDQLLKGNRVKKEDLYFAGNRLYGFDGQDAHLFRDDFTPGPVFPQDWSRSGVASIPERGDNQRLTWFRHRMGMVYVLAIDPLRMEGGSLGEQSAPHPALTNFASWYRHLTQESPETMGPLFSSLQDVMEGFTGLKLAAAGEGARILRAGFRNSGETDSSGTEFHLSLGQLSEGQRCLIALFTILHCAVRPDMTICIDEPDNFVALRELQPWVTELCDRVEKKAGQCLLVSHHPELIDVLAVRHGARFTRTGLGPVRIKPFEWSEADGIRPSELVARGWEE